MLFTKTVHSHLTQKQIRAKLEKVKRSFIGLPVQIGTNGYPYVLFPLTDFEPPVHPSLIEDMADLLVNIGHFENADLIVSEDDRGGGPLTHAVACRTDLPYTLANWYPAGITGQIKVDASIGFSGKGNIYVNGIKPRQKIIIIDDILSSGGTSIALVKAVRKARAEVLEMLFVGEKVDQKGRMRIHEEFPDLSVNTLVKFTAQGGKVKEIL